jgi:hypothetical protein
MANRVATILGIGFLLVGVVGFIAPDILGMHLTLAHNIVHLVTGAVSLWLGLKGTPSAAKNFCVVFGLVYLLLGVAGFVAGSGAEKMLELLPGQLMFGRMDHIVHILLGAVYLIGGFATRTVPATRTA